jgi:Ni2+-binding GTPase involved in maturation of urease and hydrogenase
MKVDPSRMERDAKKINPQAPFVRTNSIKGIGISKVIDALGLKM